MEWFDTLNFYVRTGIVVSILVIVSAISIFVTVQICMEYEDAPFLVIIYAALFLWLIVALFIAGGVVFFYYFGAIVFIAYFAYGIYLAIKNR